MRKLDLTRQESGLPITEARLFQPPGHEHFQHNIMSPLKNAASIGKMPFSHLGFFQCSHIISF
jgi:hypothetical protein